MTSREAVDLALDHAIDALITSAAVLRVTPQDLADLLRERFELMDASPIEGRRHGARA